MIKFNREDWLDVAMAVLGLIVAALLVGFLLYSGVLP